MPIIVIDIDIHKYLQSSDSLMWLSVVVIIILID